MEGRIVGHYRVLSPLGRGGMGIVSLGEDLRLGRRVALKFLPPELTQDASAKERFIQEARAASQLDHANICTIHEIDETADGQLYLAMAYYEGETLEHRIRRGPLRVEDALDVAVQVAHALVKAHQAGIIHRDIKPANLMLTSDGTVKVLDFGLAKLVDHTVMTTAGTTLGTLGYMSPEQAEGAETDARTDLWSLGVVLYEMLTGQQPFKGDTTAALLAAVHSHRPPPPTALRSGLPVEHDRTVDCALAKRREDRFQTATDFLSELRRLRRESEGSMPAAPSLSPARARSVVPLLGGLAALAAIAAAGFALWGAPEADHLILANPVQVTSAQGVEDFPAWSSDGTSLAYVAPYETGVTGDVWIARIPATQPVNRTGATPGPKQFAAWSPDGSSLRYYADGALWDLPALGGARRTLLPTREAPTFVAFSPDGSSVALSYRAGELEIAPLSGAPARTLPLDTTAPAHGLHWSSDGRLIAIVEAVSWRGEANRLWTVDTTSGRQQALTARPATIFSPSWSPDGRAVYYVSNAGASMDLWRQPVSPDGSPSGPPESVSTGVGMRRAIVSPDGRKVAYSKGQRVANVWRVPIPTDRIASWADAEQLTFDQAFIEFVSVTPDGRRIYVSSDRGGNQDLWSFVPGDQEMVQLTSDPAPDWAPWPSPDGSTLAFYSARDGWRNVFAMPAAGGPARQLTHDHSQAVRTPSWKADGSEIVFTASEAGESRCMAIPGAGGTPRAIVQGPCARPAWSPDGKWLTFTRGPQTWLSDGADSTETPLAIAAPSFHRWGADATRLYSPLRSSSEIVALDLRTRQPSVQVRLSGRPGALVPTSVAVDRTHVYFAWEQDTGDIWVADLVPSTRE
jgi:eukaryotic-like serine/threonine-protein kinase